MDIKNEKQLDSFMAGIPWANIAVGASIIGGVASVIGMFSEFEQTRVLKDINAKLDKVIRLQYEILQEIKKLGIQFRQDLEEAFIKDLNLELRGNMRSFEAITSVMIESDEGLIFPDDLDYDYKRRLEYLVGRTEDLANKMTGYGPITYQAQGAIMLLMDAMFKVARIPLAHRRAFMSFRVEEIDGNLEFFEAEKLKLAKAVEASYAAWEKDLATHRDIGVKGDLDAGFSFDFNPFVPRSQHARLKASYRQWQAQHQKNKSTRDIFADTILPDNRTQKEGIVKLIALYSD